MILYKSFFRHPRIQIHLILFSVLLLVLISLKAYLNYTEDYMKEAFSIDAFIEIKGSNDLLTQLKKNKKIAKIKKGLLFEYPECREVTNCNNVTTSDYPEEAVLLSELDFLERTVIKKGEIILPVSNLSMDFSPDETKIGKTIKLIDSQKNSYSFQISSFYQSNQFNYYVNQDDFKQLESSAKQFYFQVFVKDYKKIYEIEEQLENQLFGQFDSMFVQKINIQKESDAYKIVNYVNILLIIFFFFLLIVTLKGLQEDLLKDSVLEYRLGFSKRTIRRIIFSQISLLLLASVAIAYLLHFFIIRELKSIIPKISPIHFHNLLEFLLILFLLILLSNLFIRKRKFEEI